MKKLIFITTCVVVLLLSTLNFYRVWGDWNTPFLSMLKLEQLAYGEGGNTGGEGGSSVKDCSIFLYNRNTREAWVPMTISPEVSAGSYITLPNGKRVQIGVSAGVSTTILYPDCIDSEGNCCVKTWLNQSIRYV
ncbi:MAG: hypothetical protein ACLTSL_09700 [Odoribacter splanchnicus]